MIGHRIRVWYPSGMWYLYCLRSPCSSLLEALWCMGHRLIIRDRNGKRRPQGPATVLGTCRTALSVKTPRSTITPVVLFFASSFSTPTLVNGEVEAPILYSYSYSYLFTPVLMMWQQKVVAKQLSAGSFRESNFLCTLPMGRRARKDFFSSA